jgi:hypothetical protein
MNNTIHTPPPWIYSGLNSGGEISATIFSGKSGELVGTITTKKANLMLMTAAPDLLFTLEKLLACASKLDQSATHDGLQNCEAIAQARVAIRKAKGEA